MGNIACKFLACCRLHIRVGSENQPVYYNIVQDMAADAAAAAAYNMPLAFAQPRPTQGDEHGPANSRSNDGLVKYCPPASYNAREFTMLRLYDLTPNLIRRVISEQMDLRHEDFPFRCGIRCSGHTSTASLSRLSKY